MFSQGKTTGLILMVAGVVLFLGVVAFMGSGLASGQVQASGALLGVLLCGLAPLIVLGGGGAYLYRQGSAEAATMDEVRRKQRLLGLVQAQGQASLDSLMLELKLTRDQVTRDIAELVQQGLFTGYIDWKKATLYSSDAARVTSTTCPNCGGQREIAGKGVVTCPFCGATIFMP
jgi:ribosomal protein S27AE